MEKLKIENERNLKNQTMNTKKFWKVRKINKIWKKIQKAWKKQKIEHRKVIKKLKKNKNVLKISKN